MASDPSTDTEVRRRHARKLTPVIPALPLSLSDRRWSRIAQTPPPIAEEPTPQAEAEQEVQESLPTSQNELEHQPISPEQSAPVVSEGDTGTVAPVEVTSGQEDPTSAIEARQQVQEPAELVHQEENGSINDQRHGSSTPTQPVEELSELSHFSHDQPADIKTATLTDGKKVRLVEEDILSSEQELSSRQPSSTTGPTEYGSSAAESTLETVVDQSQHPRREPSMPHRKSEAAPEVLTNGFTPTQPAFGQASHAMNGSISSIAPVVVEPPPAPLPSLQEHLQFLVSSKSFCDTILQVNQADRSYQPSLHYAHFLLLSRSEHLSKITPEVDPTTQSRVINLYPARNILPHAFEAALRFLYTDSVLTAQALGPQPAYQEKQAKVERLEYVMSYWMSGVELGLTPVKARSYDLIKDLVDWDTVEIVAKEAQDLRAALDLISNDQIKTEVLSIANMLARLVSRMLVRQLNLHEFTPDANVQPTILPTRFAHLEYQRMHKPALSGVVFGSLASQPTTASSPMSAASAIMLNMEFVDLVVLATDFAAIHGPAGVDVMRRIVELREEKREHVLANRSVPNKQRLSNSESWYAAGWQEQIDDQGQLVRERTGFTLPSRAR